jgi:hypothetical protein
MGVIQTVAKPIGTRPVSAHRESDLLLTRS